VRGLLARLEWFDGRYERALELISGMDPAGAWMPANLRFPAAVAAGQVYESMGDGEGARRSYEAALTELEARRRQLPDDYQVEVALGLAMAGLERKAEAVRHGRRAVELLPVSRDAVGGPVYLYLLAQIHSRVGEPENAFDILDEMFRVPGFYNENWIRRDPAFAALRSQPSFAARLERWSTQRSDLLLR
jgi:tetratricopeptide (TPR) repeat protein